MIRIIEIGGSTEYRPFRRAGMSYVLVVSLIFFTVLAGFLVEIGRVSVRKTKMQMLTDSHARSNRLLLARALNEITGINHQIGEAFGLVILHRAMFGPRASAADLTDEERRDDATITAQLQNLDHDLQANSKGSIDPEFLQPVRTGGAVGAAMIRAKHKLFEMMSGRGVIDLSGDANAQVASLRKEWAALNTMERNGSESLRACRYAETKFIPVMLSNQDRIISEMPGLAESLTSELRYGSKAGAVTYPRNLAVPVERERIDPNGDDAEIGRSQIVRAAYPWVVFDRQFTIEKTAWMNLTQFATRFLERTDTEAIQACRDHLARGGASMYVLTGRKIDGDKGSEKWRTDSLACDRSFGVLAFEYRGNPMPIGAPAISRENREGLLTFAQALTFAGSVPIRKDHERGAQFPTAWDTLQWDFGKMDFVPEYPGDPGRDFECPRIRLDWQARIVPVNSTLDDAVGHVPEPIAGILRRVLPVPKSLRPL